MMVASLLGGRASTALFDGNRRLGAKLAISGGGRCNLTNENLSARHYRADPYFIDVALHRYDQSWLLGWVAKGGVTMQREKRAQYFCTEGAEALNRLFRKRLGKTRLHLGEKVLSVSGTSPFAVETDRGRYRAKRVVVASGGLSFPRLGAGDIGLRIAESYGHRLVGTAPALVGLTLQPEQFFMKALSGIALPVEIDVGQRRYRDRLLFAHRGISGPAVLNASLWWERGELAIDFLPDFDLKKIEGSKRISTLLPLPKRAAKAFLSHLQIEDRPAKNLNPKERESVRCLRSYRFAPAGTFGYSRAEVTRGGISTDEVDPASMESRRVSGLYFLGEVLDVTGELGGYNLQWAFSSAAVCTEAIKRG